METKKHYHVIKAINVIHYTDEYLDTYNYVKNNYNKISSELIFEGEELLSNIKYSIDNLNTLKDINNIKEDDKLFIKNLLERLHKALINVSKIIS
jgi:hypothetical protein